MDAETEWPPARIKQVRQQMYRSTREMQERTGISARTQQAYEQGRRPPDAAALLLIRMMANEPDLFRQMMRRLEGEEN